MIVHLFPKSQFTEEFVDFINGHFDGDEHEFILYTNVPFDISADVYKYSNVFDYDRFDLSWLKEKLIKADRIILHNLGILFRELCIFFVNPALCRKTIWLIWGGDLYCYREPKTSIAEKIVETMRKRIIQRFPLVATLTDGDFTLLTEWYSYKGRNIRLDYYEGYTVELMDEIMKSESVKDGTIRILLGNSATKTNRHIEALELLAHLKNEDILIFAPLSYGDKEYGSVVIQKGKELFAEKFVPLLEYMSRDDYYRMLYKIDVGLFNNDRQQGTGNIEALLYYGKKVFIRDDTSMWPEWVDKEGYSLGNISDIKSMTLDELVFREEESVRRNDSLIRRYFDVNERVKEWDTAFTTDLFYRKG